MIIELWVILVVEIIGLIKLYVSFGSVVGEQGLNSCGAERKPASKWINGAH